jgi:hypothetical protein
METDPSKPQEYPQRKRRDKAIAIVGAVVVLAAITYKFVWPWSSLRSDLVFLGIILVGITVATVLTRQR